jgi:hypothetical protein
LCVGMHVNLCIAKSRPSLSVATRFVDVPDSGALFPHSLLYLFLLQETMGGGKDKHDESDKGLFSNMMHGVAGGHGYPPQPGAYPPPPGAYPPPPGAYPPQYGYPQPGGYPGGSHQGGMTCSSIQFLESLFFICFPNGKWYLLILYSIILHLVAEDCVFSVVLRDAFTCESTFIQRQCRVV